MAGTSYLPVPNPQQPGYAQAPFAGWMVNPQGSEYAGLYGQNETDLVKKDIFYDIVESIPKQFKFMNVLYNQGVKYRPGKEFSWREESWNRVPTIVTSAASANPQTVFTTNTAGISDNAVVQYPDNTQGMVVPGSVVTNTSFQVSSQTGAGALPALTSGQKLVVQNYTIADGMNNFVGYDRLDTVEFTNYMQYFRRSKRWTRMEQQEYRNLGTTDYMERDKALLMKEIYQDAFVTYINGHKGEYTFNAPSGGTYRAMACNGIYPSLIANGSQTFNSNPTTIQNDFAYAAFNTNYKDVDEPRYVLCTDKMWYQLSTIMKDPIRYTPADKTMDLNLTEWHMGTQKFIPIIVELMKESSYMFPAFFESMIMVLDMGKIEPECMTGYEPFEYVNPKQSLQQGGYQDWDEWSVAGMISTRVATADGHFIIYGSGF